MLLKQGKQTPLDELKSKKQFEMLMEFIPKNGLEQYEISNFAKKGFEAKHNGSYWSDDIYLGLGPSAHSFDGNRRLWNVSNNVRYIKSLQKQKLPLEFEELSEVQRYNEYILTALRTKNGVNFNYIKSRFSPFLVDFFLFSTKKWLFSEEIIKNEDIYTLSKKGKLIADWLSSDLFYIE
jgi:oxygen-independent coproporphyrinogen-3 oxidase